MYNFAIEDPETHSPGNIIDCNVSIRFTTHPNFQTKAGPSIRVPFRWGGKQLTLYHRVNYNAVVITNRGSVHGEFSSRLLYTAL